VTLRVGAAWCTHFSGVVRSAKHRRLRYAYRAPAFFADESLRSGMEIAFLRFDADFETRDLDGTVGNLAQAADVLYISSHGKTANTGFSAILHSSDWLPAVAGTGGTRPVVAVFDTCDLIDPADPAWNRHWEVSTIGLGLRLVLGFSTPATLSQATSIRGRAFVSNLVAGQTFVDAWEAAVVRTSYQGTDRPVAIGLGDSSQDASAVVNTSSLASMPGPRTQATPTAVKSP
jgi:hypothetical protein